MAGSSYPAGLAVSGQWRGEAGMGGRSLEILQSEPGREHGRVGGTGSRGCGGCLGPSSPVPGERVGTGAGGRLGAVLAGLCSAAISVSSGWLGGSSSPGARELREGGLWAVRRDDRLQGVAWVESQDRGQAGGALWGPLEILTPSGPEHAGIPSSLLKTPERAGLATECDKHQ